MPLDTVSGAVVDAACCHDSAISSLVSFSSGV